LNLHPTYTLAAPREKVFLLITDPLIVQKCIEGCEKLVRTSEDNYDIYLKLRIAGIKRTYVGRVQLKDKQVPKSYTLLIEGKGGPGFIKGTGRIQLADKGNETQLHCDGESEIGGMIAAIGSHLLEAAGKKTMDSFFKNFAGELKAAQK